MNDRRVVRGDICAVVVTYFPKSGLAENLSALAPQVGKILVIDNGSSEDCLEMIQSAAQPVGAEVIRLGKNLGIARALNIGCEAARDQGYGWLATFDQDSQSTPGMVEEMTRVLEDYPERERVAIVTPCHVDRRLSYTVRDRRHDGAGAGWRVIFSTMTSGNLLNLDVAAAVGGFDDSLFIDCVDHDFCLRLRRHGYRVLEATQAVLRHSLGNMERRFLLVKWVTVTHHVAVRRYYISRNRIIVWGRFWREQPIWVLIDVRRFFFELAYMLCFENQRAAKMRMVWLGLRHGLRGALGPYDPD